MRGLAIVILLFLFLDGTFGRIWRIGGSIPNDETIVTYYTGEDVPTPRASTTVSPTTTVPSAVGPSEKPSKVMVSRGILRMIAFFIVF